MSVYLLMVSIKYFSVIQPTLLTYGLTINWNQVTVAFFHSVVKMQTEKFSLH